MKKYDKLIGLLFFILSISFLLLLTYNEPFMNWAFQRHQNQISWFIRPFFIIPFCYFAHQKSWSGIWITVFCIFTSMLWFPQPESVSEPVKKFLEMEREWIQSQWSFQNILMALAVPASLFTLGLAFWKRHLGIGLALVATIAIGKMAWSLQSAGEAGKSIFLPALIGLMVCFTVIYFGFKRLEKKK